MLTGSLNPILDGIYFIPFAAGETTNPVAFGHLGKRIDDGFSGGATTIEDRSLGLGIGFSATGALISLATGFGFTKFRDIGALLIFLEFAIISTLLVRTKISRVREFWHLFSPQ